LLNIWLTSKSIFFNILSKNRNQLFHKVKEEVL